MIETSPDLHFGPLLCKLGHRLLLRTLSAIQLVTTWLIQIVARLAGAWARFQGHHTCLAASLHGRLWMIDLVLN